MTDKSRFGPELTKSEIDASGRVVDPEVFYSGLQA